MITDFLKTKRPKEELKIALDILREFKMDRNAIFYNVNRPKKWMKLEQLEEFLAHLVDGEPLEEDTIAHMSRKR